MKTKRHKTRGIPAKYGLRKKADSFTCRLTRPDVKSLLHVVLNNTFFTVGTTIYRQTCGIPMGISPAPFMTNLFLAAYEFQFLVVCLLPRYLTRRCTTLLLLNCSMPPNSLCGFWTTSRFFGCQTCAAACALHPPNLPYQIGLPQPLHPLSAFPGLSGIYLPYLNVTLSHLPTAVTIPFMDILISVKPAPTALDPQLFICRIITHLFDKRFSAIFATANVVINRFIHATSNVDPSAKRNILCGQFSRLAGILSDWENFAHHMAIIIYTLECTPFLPGCSHVSKSWLLAGCELTLFLLPVSCYFYF